MLKPIQTLIVSVLLSALCQQIQASEMYVLVNNTKLKSKSGDVATLFLGVPVQITKAGDKEMHVTLEGYLDGEKVYSNRAKVLLIATLDKNAKITKKPDRKVVLSGLIERGSLVEKSSEVWEEHEEFFFDMCTQCHAAPKISHHSMKEWEALFEPMKGFAKLDAEESAYLLRYIKSNASDGLVKHVH